MNQTHPSCQIAKLTRRLKESKQREADLHSRCSELMQELQENDNHDEDKLNLLLAEKQIEAVKVLLQTFVQDCKDHQISNSDPTLLVFKKAADKALKELQRRIME